MIMLRMWADCSTLHAFCLNHHLWFEGTNFSWRAVCVLIDLKHVELFSSLLGRGTWWIEIGGVLTRCSNQCSWYVFFTWTLSLCENMFMTRVLLPIASWKKNMLWWHTLLQWTLTWWSVYTQSRRTRHSNSEMKTLKRKGNKHNCI